LDVLSKKLNFITMADIKKNIEKNKEIIKEHERSDPGTTNSTDPQEHMEGPVSSLMHNIEEVFEEDDSAKEGLGKKDKE